MVATIKIGERIFLPTKDGATEVLQMNPPILSNIEARCVGKGKTSDMADGPRPQP